MVRVRNNLIAAMVLLASILLVFIINNPTGSRKDFTELKKSNYEIKQKLLKRYNAVLINDASVLTDINKQAEVLSNVVILDTIFQSISYEEGEYFLLADVNTNSKTTIKARLKLDLKNYDLLSSRKSNFALIAARINKIDCTKILSDYNYDPADTNLVAIGDEVFLAGDCIEVAQLHRDYDQFLNH